MKNRHNIYSIGISLVFFSGFGLLCVNCAKPSEEISSRADASAQSLVASNDGDIERFSEIQISRDTLGKIEGTGMIVTCAIMPSLTEMGVVLVCALTSHDEGVNVSEVSDQRLVVIEPTRVKWNVSDPDDLSRSILSWHAGFIQNRDGLYHTYVSIGEDLLRRSSLEIYFEDYNGDGERDDLTIILDMSEFTWHEEDGYIWQHIVGER